MTSSAETKLKVGQVILIEEAWEDDWGTFHDEWPTIIGFDGDYLKLKFERDDINKFLTGCEFKIADYEDQAEGGA